MLETTTLRVAFGVIALTLFILFYLVTFRRTHSAYSGWWCTALALFLFGASLYFFDGSVHQVWANPMGNTLLVAGAVSVWAAARSLRTVRPSYWQLLPAPGVTAVASVVDNPAVNDWSGGPVFLAMMCLMFMFACFELMRLQRGFSDVRLPLSVASGLLAVFYLGRFTVFVAYGPKDPLFLTFFGSEVTTLINMVLLIVVSFSMAALSSEQVTKDLSVRANQDGLTGLLNRQGFHDLAADELRRGDGSAGTAMLILADLDYFKAVNDTYGHSIGDLILQSFAAACRSAVRSTDLVGRHGGEEFVILLPNAGFDRAEAIAADISHRFRTKADGGIRYPTVSYGIASVPAGSADLTKAIASADAAMYQAKAGGRDTVARASEL